MNDKKIILCADDFGLSPGVCTGILKLAQLQRLSAVSCMVNKESFTYYAPDLQRLTGQIQIGLHFNLTEGRFLSDASRQCFSLSSLLVRTHLGLLDSSLIEQEFLAQLNCFMTTMGRLPDFIDGHQHVHQFPIIRNSILKMYNKHFNDKKVYIRSIYPMLPVAAFQFKRAVLAHTGGKALKKLLQQLSLKHNHYFAGIYDFSPSANYRVLFQQWLQHAPNNTLIMCHPGEGSDNQDVIRLARVQELNYFSSDAFLEDCRHYKVKI